MREFGTAVILAGGNSKRMGFDKQMIPIGDEFLIDKLYRRLSVIFDEVVIISNKKEIYKGRDYIVKSDDLVDGGPLSGIHRALLTSHSRYVFITACDMPNISEELIEYMKKRINESSYCASVALLGNWIEPFHGFYSVKLLKGIEECIEKKQFKISNLLKKYNVDYIEESEARRFTLDWSLFLNLNSQDELNEYLKKRTGDGDD